MNELPRWWKVGGTHQGGHMWDIDFLRERDLLNVLFNFKHLQYCTVGKILNKLRHDSDGARFIVIQYWTSTQVALNQTLYIV